MILAILGAASIVGGIVAYRGSTGVGVRAFGAAAIAAGVVMWAVILLTMPVRATRGEGTATDGNLGDGQDRYEVTVWFNTSVTQDDIAEVEALLRSYDEDAELLMTRCDPPMGVEVVTTDVPEIIAAEVEAKSYVNDASYRPWEESIQGGRGIAVEAQAAARCG